MDSVRQGLKVSAASWACHVYLGVHFLWFSAFVSWVEISVGVTAPQGMRAPSTL